MNKIKMLDELRRTFSRAVDLYIYKSTVTEESLQNVSSNPKMKYSAVE